MSKISLEEFINKTKGTKVDIPWGEDTSLKGQCVSLVQTYIQECLEQPAHPRGNAVDWIQTYVNEGLGYTVSDQKTGDIIVFPNEADGYGHIAIWVDGRLYDQNNLRHDNGLAGYCDVFSWDFVTLRPNAEVIVNEIKEEPTPEPIPEPIEEELKVGDIVVPIELVDYDGTPLVQYDDNYVITELVGDRAVLSANRDGELIIWAALNTNNIKR